jgi:hypothetical protein
LRTAGNKKYYNKKKTKELKNKIEETLHAVMCSFYSEFMLERREILRIRKVVIIEA